MYNVVIAYVDGEQVQFAAQSFDDDFRKKHAGESRSLLRQPTFSDADGNDAFIYLAASRVAGVVLVPQ